LAQAVHLLPEVVDLALAPGQLVEPALLAFDQRRLPGDLGGLAGDPGMLLLAELS
jgi:hypothetical protein